MEPAVLNLLNNSPAIIVFLGMFALVWKSLSIAHDLSKLALAKPQVLDGSTLTPVPVAKPSIPVPPTKPTVAPPTTEVVNEALVSAVKGFEGFSAKSYGDFKQWSIGYGTRATGPNQTITKEQADIDCRHELAEAEAQVEAFAPNAPKGVKQALTSLTYNSGTKWEEAGLGAKIKAGDYEGAKTNFLQYNHAGGEVDDGLTKRREAEVKWFDQPI